MLYIMCLKIDDIFIIINKFVKFYIFNINHVLWYKKLNLLKILYIVLFYRL